MAITPTSQIRNIKGLKPHEIQRVSNYLQGAVYSMCNNRTNDWFSVRNLFGGKNWDWTGTPMKCLYDNQIRKGKTHKSAIKGAGNSAGWLLKKVLSDDNRIFETKVENRIRKYRWKN